MHTSDSMCALKTERVGKTVCEILRACKIVSVNVHEKRRCVHERIGEESGYEMASVSMRW